MNSSDFVSEKTLRKKLREAARTKPKVRELTAAQEAYYAQFPVPTPEEIKERCAKERESWSEEEYRKRAGVSREALGTMVAQWSPEGGVWAESADYFLWDFGVESNAGKLARHHAKKRKTGYGRARK